MALPRITIGGFPLSAQRFSWTFSSGASPDLVSFSFPASTADLIGSKIPTNTFLDLEIKQDMEGFGAQALDAGTTIKDLILLSPDNTGSPWEGSWTLVDQRWYLQGIKHSSTYNLRREVNDMFVGHNPLKESTSFDVLAVPDAEFDEFLSPPKVAGPENLLAPDNLVEDNALDRFARFGKSHYLTWTVKPDGEPYTAYDILVHIAGGIATRTGPAGVVGGRLLRALKDVPDGLRGNYIESDVRMEQEDVSATLDTWLEKAELGLGVVPDGTLYAYSLLRDADFPTVISPFPPTVQGGGYIASQDLGRIRAGTVAVSFPREVEQRFEARVDWQTASHSFDPKKPSLHVQNVLRVPDDITYKGKVYRTGVWMEVRDAMAAWSTQLPVPGNLNRRTVLNDEQVRKLWFPNGYLMMNYGLSYQVGDEQGNVIRKNSALWGPRISALIGAYRQTWRIHPALMPYILEWRMERVGIIDAISETRIPAYASVDHAIIPQIMLAEFKRNRGGAATNIAAHGESVDGSVGAPVSLSVLDQAQGVFKVNWDSTSGAGEWLSQIVPSQLEPDTIPTLGVALETGRLKWWHDVVLRKQYKAFFIFSVRYGTIPYTVAKRRLVTAQRQSLFYTIEVPAAKAVKNVGAGTKLNDEIVQEFISREDTARFMWKGNNATLKAGAKPVNHGQLSAIATAKAEQYYFTMRDRLLGQFTVPGWSKAYRLFGAMRRLTITVDEEAAIETTFDFAKAPQPRELYHLLPAGVRNSVYKQLPRAKGGN